MYSIGLAYEIAWKGNQCVFEKINDVEEGTLMATIVTMRRRARIS